MKSTTHKSTGIVSSQNVTSHANMTSENLATEEYDKKLKSCKPVVILQKLQLADIDKYLITCPIQTVSYDVKNLETKESENSEISSTLIYNDHLSKNIDCLKPNYAELIDAKPSKTDIVTKPVIEMNNLLDKLSVMNPDDAFSNSDTSELSTRTTISSVLANDALMASEHSDEALTVPEHSDEGLTVPEHIDEGLTVPEHIDEGLTVPEHSDEALIVPEHSDEALIVPEHSDEALIVPEHSDEGLTVPEHSDEPLTVPEHSDEALTVPEHSDEALTVLEHSDEALTVPEHSDEALTVPEHSDEALTVPEHSDEALTVPEHSDEALTVPEHSDEALTVPEHSDEAVTVTDHSDEALTVPEHNDEALTVPEHSDDALTVPEHSDDALTVPDHSDEALTVPEHRDDALIVPEHSDEAITVPDHSDEALAVPEHSDEALAVLEHSDEAVAVPELSNEAVAVPDLSNEALAVPEHSDEALAVPEHSDEALAVPELCDEALAVPKLSDEAPTVPEHSDEAPTVPEHSDEIKIVPEHNENNDQVSGHSDEVQPVSGPTDEAPVVFVRDLIDNGLDADVMTFPEPTEESVTGSDQTGRPCEAVEWSKERLMPGIIRKKMLVGAQMIKKQTEEPWVSEQISQPLLSHEQGEKVLTGDQTSETPIVSEYDNESMLTSEQTDVAGLTAEHVCDSYSTDQTEDSMTDMELVYKTLKIGQTGEALSESPKTDKAPTPLPVSNIQAEASSNIDEIGSEQPCRTSSILQTSGPLEMSIDANNDCSLQNDLSSKVQEALATIENSGSIDELKRTILENTAVQDTFQSETTLSEDKDALNTIPEEQTSADGTVERTMIDDSVVFDDGPTTKQAIAVTESHSTEAQEITPGDNITKKDEVKNNSNKEEVILQSIMNNDPFIEVRTGIVDYDEEEMDEDCTDKSGRVFEELVKYDISDDDCFQGSDSDNEEKHIKSENSAVTKTVQTQDFDGREACEDSNSGDNRHTRGDDSLISASTEETNKKYHFTNKDITEDDSLQIKCEHVQVIEGMSGESPESGSQSGLFKEEQDELGSSSPATVDPAHITTNVKHDLQDQNTFEEGAPHFYLVGDDLVSNLAANIPTPWLKNITVLTGEKLTLSEVPALLKERVSTQHLNQRQPVYFICFVGLFNFIQLEASDCMRTDSPKCQCQVVTLPVNSRNGAEAQLRSRVANIKKELAKLVAGKHYLIVPDIQLIDISRYQKYLDKVHTEVFGHELKHSESAKRFNQTIAIDLVGIIVYLNAIIRCSYAFVDNKLPWLLSLWQIEKPFNRNKLRQIPVTNGYLLTDSATKIVTDCLTELLDDYTKPDVPTSLQRVYFIGDPRLSVLASHWPENGVEIVTINDGNLVPSMVVQKIKNECQEMERCLIVICFSMKSHVIIKSVSSCEGHDPCKYVVYQDTNARVVERKTFDMVDTICRDLKNSYLTCEIAFSPLLPVNYFKYRSIIEMRHLKNTGHSITGQLPDSDASNKETIQMARDIGIAYSVMITEMKRRDISVLDIPSCILEPDVVFSTAQLVNGMSLTVEMAKKIVNITLNLVHLLNNRREKQKITNKLAKYKLLRDSVGNTLNQGGVEQQLASGCPDQSSKEDLSNRLHGISRPHKSPDSVSHKTELSNKPQDSQQLFRPHERFDPLFTKQSHLGPDSSMSSKLLSRLGGISQYSPDPRVISSSTTHRPLSPRRGKSRSPRKDDSRLPRRDWPHGRDRTPPHGRDRTSPHGRVRTPSPKRKRSRSPRSQRYWSPRSVKSRSPRRDRSFSPCETRDRYSQRGRSRSKSVDSRSRNKRSSSRPSRRDRNKYPKRERSKSRSRSHSRRRRSKSFNSARKSGLEVVSKKEFSKIYDRHVQSFQPFLAKPENHPDYKNWLKKQELTASPGCNYALNIRLNWERRMNELMNISWKNIKKRFSVEMKIKKPLRSDSSTSTSSSSRGGGAKRKKSSKHKKRKRSESYAASSKLHKAALNKEDARNSASASTSSISALVDKYCSQLPSQPSTNKYSDSSSREISQSKSDDINWAKSFVEVPPKHDCEASTHLADASCIPRSSVNVPNYSARYVYQPSPIHSNTRDYTDRASTIQSSRSRPSEPEVSSTSDRTNSKSLKIIEILKLLVQVKGKAGAVGETLPLVLNRVQSARDRGVRELSCFNSDDIILLGLIKNRLSQTSQEPHVSFIEKVIIDEAVSQLETLMEVVQDALDNTITFFDINVLSQVTEKYSISESMTYIKNLLGEFKRPNSEDDVLPVFVELVKLRGAL